MILTSAGIASSLAAATIPIKVILETWRTNSSTYNNISIMLPLPHLEASMVKNRFDEL
jgi:hypothetical protein